MAPESIEIPTQSIDAGGIELVEPPGADSTVDHEVRVLENPQVLRYRGPGNGKVARQLTDRQRPLEEPLENRPTSRIAERIQLRLWVSHY